MPALDPIPPVLLSGQLFAYIGLGPGQELIPYFLSLLAVMGTALIAVVQWPLACLRRRLSRPSTDFGGAIKGDPVASRPADQPCRGSPDKV